MHTHHTWGLDPRLAGWLFKEAPRRGGRGRHRHHRGGGPFGFGPPGMHRGRARRGDVRAALLALLAEEPRNGYQLMQEIENRSGGAWRPSPGSVYPALQQLEDEGLVRAEPSGTGKLFQLTDEGRAAASAGDEAPWDAVSEAVEGDAWDLLGAMKQVGLATFQIAQIGQPGQVAAAREILANARKALYGILAGDGPEPPWEA